MAKLNYADFLYWLITILTAAAINIFSIVKQTLRSTPDAAEIVLLVAIVENSTFFEPGTQQVRQVIRLALGLSRLFDGDQCVEGMLQILFVEQHYVLSFIKGGAYIQLIVPSSQKRGPDDNSTDKADFKVVSPS